jgi:uncharacterized membrane protein YuzA (DUF378 family)
MRTLNLLAGALLVVGGLNWGLVALAEFDLVAWIFGEEFGTTNAASRLVYGIVGLSAVAPTAPRSVMLRCAQWSEQIAEAMTAVTAFGREISVRCEPPWDLVMCECARRAIASSDWAVMI